ncbi:MAG: ribbon-helix-helix protein, CopG family [Bdellovibrionota bacterium]
MAVRKIAISLPEDLLRQVDQLAKRTKTTRSGCIARVLSEVTHAKNQAEITARIDELFGNGELAEEQGETASEFLRAAEPGFEDSEW